MDTTTVQNIGGTKTFTAGITKLDAGATGLPYITWNQNAINRLVIGAAYNADDFVVGSVLGDAGFTAYGGRMLFSVDSGVSPVLTLDDKLALIGGNVKASYSAATDFAFYTDRYVEVMGNAYWDGDSYNRYVLGKASKISVAPDGNILLCDRYFGSGRNCDFWNS